MAYSEKQIEERFTEICRQIAQEGKSLRKVLLHNDMPESHTFYKWVDSSEEKLLHYTRAINLERPNVIFEEILVIADSTEDDIITNEEGFEVTNHNVIQRDRLRVDARKWMLGKMNPKKYSDKIQVDTTEFSEQPLFPNVPKDNSNK